MNTKRETRSAFFGVCPKSQNNFNCEIQYNNLRDVIIQKKSVIHRFTRHNYLFIYYCALRDKVLYRKYTLFNNKTMTRVHF